jgi:putative membrane protein
MFTRTSFACGAVALAMLSAVPTFSQQPAIEERHDFSKLTDEQFVKMAEQINLTEIAAGNHAATKAKRPEVQRFGQQMVNEHSNANRKLTAAVNKKWELAGKLDAKHQAKVDKLTALSLDEFDRTYMQEMVKGHQMAKDLMEQQAAKGKDAALKSYAEEILPGVRMHLQKAQQLVKEIVRN